LSGRILIFGPPGSGKTHAVMGEVRRLLDAGARDFRLLVPTATMAEHLRNQLAREGFAFPPELVSTLTRFLAGYSKGLEQAPPAALPLIVETALSRRAPAAFAKVAGFAGFSTYLARLIEDFASVGCGVERLSGLVARLGLAGPIVSGFLEIYRAAEVELRKRGWLLRGELLSCLASRIQSGPVPGVARVFFDGFLSMTDPELEVAGALAAHADVTVTLPAWSGADAARETLLKIGFREEQLTERRRARPAEVIVEARSQAEEVDEIARRILAGHSTGRPWREMGVILRSAGTYAPALRSSFERFGIPARFYFAQPAAEHEVIRFLTGVERPRSAAGTTRRCWGRCRWRSPAGTAASSFISARGCRGAGWTRCGRSGRWMRWSASTPGSSSGERPPNGPGARSRFALC